MAQRAGSSVARVGIRAALKFEHVVVDVGEIGQREIHLAAHFQYRGQGRGVRCGRQPRGDRREPLHVGGDVLPHPTVAAGSQRGQLSVAVHQVDGQAVHLQFAQQLREVAYLLDHPVHPRLEVGGVEGVVQAHHAFEVFHRLEHLRPRTADCLGGRITGDQLRVGGLQRHEFAVELVVLGIGDGGGVVEVVVRACGVDLFDEVGPAALVSRGERGVAGGAGAGGAGAGGTGVGG